MTQQQKSVIPGIILIIVGGLIILHKLDIFHIYWRDIYPVLFIGLGLWFFLNVFVKKQRGLAFPGTLFLLLGLFFVLRNYHIFYRFYIDEYWPIFLIILGLAFVVQFLFRPQDWGILIPGTIFLVIGLAFLARTMHWLLPYEIEFYFEKYWPVLLILIGLGIILSSFKKKADTT